ncbi:hypothetical protein ACGFIR_12705 [Micromonospora sp. NPDC049051]|uniref:hypothetical protein n=1 Tax=Micromonospora sp. NPDC049051 TaxID=3364264 RepID=UPI003719FA52
MAADGRDLARVARHHAARGAPTRRGVGELIFNAPTTVDGAQRFACRDNAGQSTVWHFLPDGRFIDADELAAVREIFARHA